MSVVYRTIHCQSIRENQIVEETLYEKSERLRHYGWGKINVALWLALYMFFKYIEVPYAPPELTAPQQAGLILFYIIVGAMWSFGWGYYYYRKAR